MTDYQRSLSNWQKKKVGHLESLNYTSTKKTTKMRKKTRFLANQLESRGSVHNIKEQFLFQSFQSPLVNR